MKILYIHHDRHQKTGAHFINDIIVKGLRKAGVTVDNVYPEEDLGYFSPLLAGIENILFFFSLIERKKDIQSYDIVQGTTFSPIAFLHSAAPVVSMFGSTGFGLLKHLPTTNALYKEHNELGKIFNELRERGVFSGLVPPVQPTRDIGRIELHVAKNSKKVIVTSECVKAELVKNGVPPAKIALIWNGIENFWFTSKPKKRIKNKPAIVYLGRMGASALTVKLKGINRMIYVLRAFNDLSKTVIGLTEKADIYTQIFKEIPKTAFCPNLKRRRIPKILRKHYGDILINTSRYEGFCLSLIEGMSQGLIPISFPVGVAPEIIKDGQNGFLVHSLRQMLRKINKLSADKTKRMAMARAAFDTSRLFRADKMIQEYLNIYRSIRAEENGAPALIAPAVPVSA